MTYFYYFTTMLVVCGALRLIFGLPIRRPRNEQVDFEETWVTAYPLRFGYLTTANNCMWVQVTRGQVRIHMHFPFCIFFIPELFGFGWQFRKESVISCYKTLQGVAVRYQGRLIEREFVVYVSDKDAFLKAVNNV